MRARHQPTGATSAAVQGTHRAALVNITIVQPAERHVRDRLVPARRPGPPCRANVERSRRHGRRQRAVVPIDADGNRAVYTTATAHVVVDVARLLRRRPVAGHGAGGSRRCRPLAPVSTLSPPATRPTNVYTRTRHRASDAVVNVPIGGPARRGSRRAARWRSSCTALGDVRTVPAGNVVAAPARYGCAGVRRT